jgi:hypothetical protein
VFGDFSRKVRPGQDSDCIARKELAQNLAHPHAGAMFDSLGATQQQSMRVADHFPQPRCDLTESR